ncbi:MAG: AAA family ATPase [Thiomonas sp.]
MNPLSAIDTDNDDPHYRFWSDEPHRLLIPTALHAERVEAMHSWRAATEKDKTDKAGLPNRRAAGSDDDAPDFSQHVRGPEDSRDRLLFNVQTLQQLWTQLHGAASGGDVDKRDRKCVKDLLAIGPWRRTALADDAEDHLEHLAQSMRHFSGVVDDLRDAVTLARRGRRPLSVPPILLLGPPGVGKTHFTQEAARCLGLPTHTLALDAANGPGALAGSSRYWSNTRTGLVFEALARGYHMSPILLLDEVDKAPRDERMDPLRCLHGLLEPVTAAQFKDESFALPLDARHVVWIATANDASRIEPSLLSRFLVHTIGEPDADQRLKTARHLFRQLLREYDAPDLRLHVSEYAIEKVAQANPRQQRVLVRRAVARTLRSERRVVQAKDVPDFGAAEEGRRMGFL